MLAQRIRSLQSFISQKTKRIFIIPTKYGIYFLLTLFTLFLISLSFGHSLAFTTTFIFFSLIMVSAHFTNYNIDKVDVISLRGVNVVAEEVGEFDVLVYNPSNKWRFDMSISFVHSGKSEVFSLGPYEKKSIRLTCPIAERGPYEVKKMRLYTTFPFGLFYAWSFREIVAHFDCLPRVHRDAIDLPPAQSYDNVNGDETLSGGVGSDEFYGHINYQPGMTLKGIDWKAMARGRGRLIKKFVEFGGSRVVIDFAKVDGSLEEKLEKLAYLIKQADELGFSYSLNLAGSRASSPRDFGSGEEFKKMNLLRVARWKAIVREMT